MIGWLDQSGHTSGAWITHPRQLFAHRPQPLRRSRINSIRLDPSHLPRLRRAIPGARRQIFHQRRHVPIIAIHAAQAGKLGAGGAPQLRGRPLRDALVAPVRVDQRAALVVHGTGGAQFLEAQVLCQLRVEDAAGVNRESAYTVGLAEPVVAAS